MPIEPIESGSKPPKGRDESLSAVEYRELRATIRERGSLRHLVVLITFSVWALTMMWAASALAIPLFIVIPLVVLVAGFEVGFALHVGVERIGRYLQIRYEAETGTLVCWERTAMALRVPAGGIDPLFVRVYVAAAILNMLVGVWSSAATETSSETPAGFAELAVFALVHLAVIGRWIWAARFARSQRSRELAAFETILR
jgi:hypothetical protein